MKLLFFLTKLGKKNNVTFLVFLEEFIKNKKFKCILLFEEFDDYFFFKKKFINTNNLSINFLNDERKENLFFFENYC